MLSFCTQGLDSIVHFPTFTSHPDASLVGRIRGGALALSWGGKPGVYPCILVDKAAPSASATDAAADGAGSAAQEVLFLEAKEGWGKIDIKESLGEVDKAELLTWPEGKPTDAIVIACRCEWGPEVL